MALTIVWTPQAVAGYVEILDYLESNWTQKEIKAFEQQVSAFLLQLSHYPDLLRKSKFKGVRRGPINRLTIVTYRVRLNRLEILNLRSARKKPQI